VILQASFLKCEGHLLIYSSFWATEFSLQLLIKCILPSNKCKVQKNQNNYVLPLCNSPHITESYFSFCRYVLIYVQGQLWRWARLQGMEVGEALHCGHRRPEFHMNSWCRPSAQVQPRWIWPSQAGTPLFSSWFLPPPFTALLLELVIIACADLVSLRLQSVRRNS
jgi:hypothetical protein